MLAMHLWARATAHTGSRAVLVDAVLGTLEQYDWPGNIRELENVLAVLAVRAPRRGIVQLSSLPARLVRGIGSDTHCSSSELQQEEGQGPTTLAGARRQFDASFISSVLRRHRACRTRAARELGVTRQGLAKLVQRLRLGSGEEADRFGRGARCAPHAEEPTSPVDGGT